MNSDSTDTDGRRQETTLSQCMENGESWKCSRKLIFYESTFHCTMAPDMCILPILVDVLLMQKSPFHKV